MKNNEEHVRIILSEEQQIQLQKKLDMFPHLKLKDILICWNLMEWKNKKCFH